VKEAGQMAPATTPAPEGDAFWGFEDLGLFLGALLPAFLVGMILVRAGRLAAPRTFASEAVQALVFQAAIYLVLAGALGWTFHFRGAWLYLAVAPVLAISVSALAALLHARDVPTPVESLITSRASLVAVLLFAALVGPVFEELVFRGFIYPLLARALGAWPGIVLTAAAFGVLHGPEYLWSWQHVLAVGIAGVVFGIARYRTGSTAAAALMHIGYNATYVVGYLIARRGGVV
jgi:hypothetical protein